jgi:hypothetical protein
MGQTAGQRDDQAGVALFNLLAEVVMRRTRRRRKAAYEAFGVDGHVAQLLATARANHACEGEPETAASAGGRGEADGGGFAFGVLGVCGVGGVHYTGDPANQHPRVRIWQGQFVVVQNEAFRGLE